MPRAKSELIEYEGNSSHYPPIEQIVAHINYENVSDYGNYIYGVLMRNGQAFLVEGNDDHVPFSLDDWYKVTHSTPAELKQKFPHSTFDYNF